MIRIVHTACIGLLVTVALIAYGVKEETRDLRRQVEALKAERQIVRDEISTLEAEWDYLNSPRSLRRIANLLYGSGGLRDSDGAELLPITAAQLYDLGAPLEADPLATADIFNGVLATNSIPRDAKGPGALDLEALDPEPVAPSVAFSIEIGASQ